jgi:hypothetical protein
VRRQSLGPGRLRSLAPGQPKYLLKQGVEGETVGGKAREERRKKRVHFPSQGLVVPARPIPLEQQEFRIVAPAHFAAAKGPGQLIDRPAPRREEPLHEVFRGGLERSAFRRRGLKRRIGHP